MYRSLWILLHAYVIILEAEAVLIQKENAHPDFWVKTPVAKWNEKFPSSPRRRTSRSPPSSPSHEPLPDVLKGIDLTLPQLFQVDEEIVKTFKDDGAGKQNLDEFNYEKACIIQVAALSESNSPILLIGDTPLQPLPWFDQTKYRNDGAFFVENGQEVRRYCPGDYIKMSSYTCKDGVLYKGDNKAVGEKLVCEYDYMPHIFHYKHQCNDLDPTSTVLYSGYIVPSAKNPKEAVYFPFVHLCWQKQSAMAYWSKIRMHGMHSAGTCLKRKGDFVNPPNGIYASDINISFGRANKKEAYKTFLGTDKALKWFIDVDKGHFTAYMDALYYPWQLLTNEYMNQAAQHAHINERNHMYLEKEVRATVGATKESVVLVTGPLGYIRREDITLDESLLNEMSKDEVSEYKNIPPKQILTLDFKNQQLPFNKYYFKILYEPKHHKGIVFLSSNIPIRHEVDKFCTDVCNEYGWLKTFDRFNFKESFAYCCSLPEFLEKFPYIAKSLKADKTEDWSKVQPLEYRNGFKRRRGI